MILLVGYRAPPGFETSPSVTVTQQLDGQTVGGHDIDGYVVPTNPAEAARAVDDLVAAYDPAVVIGLGEDPDASAVGVERIGIDVPATLTPAEEDGGVTAEGQPAYFTTLPTERIVQRLAGQDIPARLAIGEGPDRNNELGYAICRAVHREELGAAAGFVHLPLSPGTALARADSPETGGRLRASLPRETQAKAVGYVALTAVRSL